MQRREQAAVGVASRRSADVDRDPVLVVEEHVVEGPSVAPERIDVLDRNAVVAEAGSG
jgi:hypothetical protein